MLTSIDPQQLAQITRDLMDTSYHQLLAETLQARIAELQAENVTTPYGVMKNRGQVEELQRLLLPAAVQQLALRGLAHRALAEPEALATVADVRRDWWEEESS